MINQKVSCRNCVIDSLLLGRQALLNGMDSIVKVLQYFRDQKKYQDVIDGYCGTLIENFECDKTFFTAVEVTAGNRSVKQCRISVIFYYFIFMVLYTKILYGALHLRFGALNSLLLTVLAREVMQAASRSVCSSISTLTLN